MSTLLTAEEMTSLRRALAKRTGGRVSVGRRPITVKQGIALWHATESFLKDYPSRSELKEAALSRQDPPHDGAALRRMIGTAGVTIAAVSSLAGCATFGGNVRGSFSCRAPDGICAPTTKIDDAALALIGGTEASMAPARPSFPAKRAEPAYVMQTSAQMPDRVGEKVLRIYFPAHIDGAGRYREASAIHAVVERGGWMSASRNANAFAGGSRISAPAAGDQAAATNALRQLSLSELAASSPQVRFPDAPAEIEPQNAEKADTLVVTSAPQKAALAEEKSPIQPVPPAIGSAPLPQADPVAAIKALVSQRLKAPERAGDHAPEQKSANSQASALDTGLSARENSDPATREAPFERPANSPSSFPVSRVKP